MSEFYGPADEAESIAVIHRALDLGITFLDTADMYGPFTNEQSAGPRDPRPPRSRRARHQVRDRARAREPASAGVNGRPEYVPRGLRREPATARRRHVDLYYSAPRRSRTCRSRTRVGAMADLVKAGKVRCDRPLRGVARDDAPRARRASDRRAPDRVLAARARRRGRGASGLPRARHRASSPTARSAEASSPGAGARAPTSTPDDYRLFSPRFAEGRSRANLELVERVAVLAARKRCTPRSWRSPGCCTGARGSSRFPGRRAGRGSKRTRLRRPSR